MIIREMRKDDLSAVWGLLRQLAEVLEDDEPLPALARLGELYDEMARLPQVYYNCVAEDDERVVGFLSLMCYRTFFHTGGTALINELVVAEDYRGRGVGRRLIAHAVEAARDRAVDEIDVSTEFINEKAQQFYQACGFDGEFLLLSRDLE